MTKSAKRSDQPPYLTPKEARALEAFDRKARGHVAKTHDSDGRCTRCGFQEPDHDPKCIHYEYAKAHLDAIVDTVLAYRPKAKSKPARRRKRRAAKIAKAK